jgi:hypothetical protein
MYNSNGGIVYHEPIKLLELLTPRLSVCLLPIGVLIRLLVVVISCMGLKMTRDEELDAQTHSMVNTLAYHCKRCNYLWLPKDYEFRPDNGVKHLLKYMPNSCARCKSKYWRQERVNREPIVLPPFINPLNKWAEGVVKMGRKEGYDDRRIATLIVEYGRKGNYSNSQISGVLRYNGVERYKRYRSSRNKK